ncbi:biotin--[acetyl-CoA-carboxylase] ligase [Haladaptatus paucihalophilus DX253]|uniref:Biotin--[acetyl-CoA-carboxylase] ligase n=1 Tax=Haladaptatus paucihalophilus DX253 TaxID=797209 RepID=E7QUM6_HALPU|nr:MULTISPECIES: bifunctional biotin--[acetyl-CoA-carboxylase] synthetase/biotin operon repressor [Haladaptatus]EFW91683.1 biotin--[acetyl-CoA-carboxylase] ligase [Haladaptatus paucihalophilus DX253]GKZ12297.1 bifunctional biotin--[acetyl-CoA-carboxylase] synthetase/biotin operon repressor [Haladaptatus sp. T7]SHJ97172.1 BirA family transcriptional regulator, biotin operon repressor / biotin-[acetyl-CoA-carboxylase] ligase [Haladaptatus paucihalophilus DX253]
MNETRRAVLDALADGPVSGPELADSLDISRNAIWKHVEALRTAGFEIESTSDGYLLDDVPEFGPSVEYGLDAPFSVEYHDSIGSTNDRARELAEEGAEDVVVLADEQVGGRGRLERTWVGPSGGVWLSLVLRPNIPPAHAPLLTLAAAVAVARAAREAGVPAEIKWPNDVLVSEERANEGQSDRSSDDVLVSETSEGQSEQGTAAGARGGEKLCGILTEMEGEANRVSWVIVGTGINVNIPADDLPEGATSVQEVVGSVNRRVFVQRVLEEFDALRTDVDAVLPAWRELSATLGQRVRVETTNGDVVGTAVDIVTPGALVVETDDGDVRVHAGDCDHLRPAN